MGTIELSELLINRDYKDALRPLTEQEYTRLYKSIEREGVQKPIRIDFEYQIVDGHHRVKVCEDLGEERIDYVFVDPDDPVKWIKEMQISRRNLSNEDIENMILKRVSQKKEERGETRGRPKKASSEVIFTEPENTGDSENHPLLKIEGKKISEEVAEEITEETGIPVSKSKVERTIAKQKPKKFKPKETVRIVLAFYQDNQYWTPFNEIFHNKKKAKDYFDERRAEKMTRYMVDYKLAYCDVDFFTDMQQQTWALSE